ncbi:MAG: hypothetical protein HIU81_03940 [Acidobacteria bacterium]|nr:hypothetical protein [Acidobacteriota bacterium]
MADLAAVEDLEGAWRPLTDPERTKASYYLGAVSRSIRRRWKDVDLRLANGTLGVDDVKDVVIQLVLPKLDAPPVFNAKSWSQAAGPYNQQVTLQSGSKEVYAFEDWMVEVFEGSSTPGPVFHMPPSGRYEPVFIWPEGGC